MNLSRYSFVLDSEFESLLFLFRQLVDSGAVTFFVCTVKITGTRPSPTAEIYSGT